MALIRNAIDQGTRVIDTIAKRMGSKSKTGSPGVVDVLIVGAGPAGLAATFRAAEKNLSYTTVSQEDVGGTIRKYPRRKLTLVQTVNLPLYGRIDGREYAKEEIIEMWEGMLQKHRVMIKTGAVLQMIRRAGDHLEVETSLGVFACRSVVLALGRRGAPRKLNVPGEEAEKVLYQLIDASTYTQQHILVVGGGDSAIEAATALANQRGNVVTLSYRKDAFFRLKPRNEQRIKDYIEKKRVRVLFSSEVKFIGANRVTLEVAAQGKESRLEIPNNMVLVLAGGDPPFALLKKIGIRFGGESSLPPTARAVA
jgi:thioredoxin reductase